MSESNRISRLLYGIRQCQIQAAIKKAKASAPCSGDCNKVTESSYETPLESGNLNFNLNTKFTGFIGSTPTTASSNTLTVEQTTLINSKNPLDPTKRFAQYAPPLTPPVCIPVPRIVLNANIPKQSLNNCPLGNKPYLPTLPV
jgi:hypothetical protein